MTCSHDFARISPRLVRCSICGLIRPGNAVPVPPLEVRPAYRSDGALEVRVGMGNSFKIGDQTFTYKTTEPTPAGEVPLGSVTPTDDEVLRRLGEYTVDCDSGDETP